MQLFVALPISLFFSSIRLTISQRQCRFSHESDILGTSPIYSSNLCQVCHNFNWYRFLSLIQLFQFRKRMNADLDWHWESVIVFHISIVNKVSEIRLFFFFGFPINWLSISFKTNSAASIEYVILMGWNVYTPSKVSWFSKYTYFIEISSNRIVFFFISIEIQTNWSLSNRKKCASTVIAWPIVMIQLFLLSLMWVCFFKLNKASQ